VVRAAPLEDRVTAIAGLVAAYTGTLRPMDSR
jgi:hypothetical protein